MLELKNVSKQLGDFKLKNINLQIKKDEYFVILGPTGTGKTVILEMIAGLYTPDEGKILFNGKNFSKLPPEERNIGFVYQDYMLFPHLTVKKNIEFGVKTEKKKDKIKELIKLMNIENLTHRFPDTLSGGEQQRTAIARALITSPQMLLLDEPLSALDPQTKNKFKKELNKLHNLLETTTIHITHDFTEAIYLADRIAIMQDGKIVQVGTPSQIFRTPQSVFIANFIGMENIFKAYFKGDKLYIDGNLEITVAKNIDKNKKNISLAIRPENIILTKEKVKSSARNNFKGEIIDIIDQGALSRLTIDIGVLLNVLITNNSLNELNLKINDQVWTNFKASEVHVL
jgi:molybdopterin-binding protein